MQKDSFLEVDPAAWSTAPRTDRMMAVFNPETGQHQFLNIRHIIAICIPEEENIRRLRNVATAISQLDPRW